MKRSVITISFAMMLATLLVSCKKYLEVNAQSNYVYVSTADDCQRLLDNYNAMSTNMPADQLLSSDEYYVTDETLLSFSVNQPTDIPYYKWDKEAIRPVNVTSTDWNSAYNRIFTANLVLENIDKLRKDKNTPELDGIEGAALFFRAFNLWHVAVLYAKPYTKAGADQDAGIPLRLASDINESISRGTVRQTYDQIVKDLERSATLLPDTATILTRASKAAAYGMLSRVFLSMSDYPAALQNATLSLAINHRLMDFNQLSTTSSTPFARYNNEVLFHVTARSSSSILSPGAATSSTAKIAPDLISSYLSQDLRKQIFFKENAGVDTGTYRFTGNYEPVTGTSFFAGIAVDEIYLTRAECYARADNANAAMADLNTLLKTRFVNTVSNPYIPFTAISASDALSQIVRERKKELVMRGLRWADLKRLNLEPTYAVMLSRTNNGITYTLPPNDLRYEMLIPTQVMASGNIPQNGR